MWFDEGLVLVVGALTETRLEGLREGGSDRAVAGRGVRSGQNELAESGERV